MRLHNSHFQIHYPFFDTVAGYFLYHDEKEPAELIRHRPFEKVQLVSRYRYRFLRIKGRRAEMTYI